MVPVTRPGGDRHDSHDGARGDALAAPRLPHHTQRLMPADHEADAVDRAQQALGEAKLDAQVAHLDEQVLGCPVAGCGGRHDRRC